MDLPDPVIPPLLRLTRRGRPFRTRAGAEKRIAARARRPRAFGPPRLLRRDVAVESARRDGWPVYTLRPVAAAPPPHGAVVYVHGGGWVEEIAAPHWQLAARIAVEARTTLIVPIYPLVPFGTAEVVNRGVVDIVREARAEFGSACLAGDSAGGQIALSAAVALRDDHSVIVPRTVLISPALDQSFSNPRIPEVAPHDPWLGVAGARYLAEVWRGELPLDDPRVSPLAADLRRLGPLTVFTGARDILNPDAHLLRDKATAAGVDVDFHERVDLVHVYPLIPTRSGRLARDVIVRTLRESLRGV